MLLMIPYRMKDFWNKLDQREEKRSSGIFSRMTAKEVWAQELKKGEKIQLVGFGTFEVSERAERTGRNPQTGKEMTIAASKAPKFKAGKALKDMINA